MTILMRDNLYQATRMLNSAHAGLLMQRGLREWEEGEKPIKKALIDTIASVKPNELYLLAFNRWLGATFDKPIFATVSAKIDGRLFTGLALGGTLETGAMTHHTYGMPMIAGSSIKGAVRNYAEHLFAERDENNQIKYDKDGQVVVQDNKKPILDILFGTDSDDGSTNAGYLIWHDAWWIPKVTSDMKLSGSDNKPFVGEVVTVHHQKYYQGEWSQALDMENPVPNQQIAIQGDFYFCIEGDENWVKFAKTLLEQMLNTQGLGAKGSNGYGYFTQSKALQPFIDYKETLVRQMEELRKEQAKQNELENAKKNASELEIQFLEDILNNNWRIYSSENQQSFTKKIDYWLDILEKNPNEQGCVVLMIEIAKIQYEKQMKRPDKAKPNQQIWIKRLLALV